MSKSAVDIVVHADVSVPYLDADVRAAVAGLRECATPLDTFTDGSWFATASVRGEVVGCARAVRSANAGTATPGLRALGPDRFDEWLRDGLELTEVVVGAGHRSRGVGTALQSAVLTPARRRRGWAQLAGTEATESGGWLRRRGWTAVAMDRWTGATVLLDPRHPTSVELDRSMLGDLVVPD